jgi:hypothetical protein
MRCYCAAFLLSEIEWRSREEIDLELDMENAVLSFQKSEEISANWFQAEFGFEDFSGVGISPRSQLAKRSG